MVRGHDERIKTASDVLRRRFLHRASHPRQDVVVLTLDEAMMEKMQRRDRRN
jgi:hypothetical protein